MVLGIGHVTAVWCFTVTQILQIVAMKRHAMMTRILFSRGVEVACDGGAHHIITDGS